MHSPEDIRLNFRLSKVHAVEDKMGLPGKRVNFKSFGESLSDYPSLQINTPYMLNGSTTMQTHFSHRDLRPHHCFLCHHFFCVQSSCSCLRHSHMAWMDQKTHTRHHGFFNTKYSRAAGFGSMLQQRDGSILQICLKNGGFLSHRGTPESSSIGIHRNMFPFKPFSYWVLP